MDEKQRWARAGHAKRGETDDFPFHAAVAFRYKYLISVLQMVMVPRRKPTRWIQLQTPPPAQPEFGSCRGRIIQSNIWILQSIDAGLRLQ
jgi:hypothetical protein